MLNYVNRVIVGKASGGGNTGATIALITRGDILILDEDMGVLSDGAAEQPIYFVVGTGFTESPFIMSSLIYPGVNLKANHKTTVAATDQVSSFASVDVPTVGEKFQVILAFKDRQRIIANRQSRLLLDAIAETTNPYDIVALLERQSRFSSPYKDPYGIGVDLTAVGTTTVSDNTVRVTQGSNSITYATAAEHNTGTQIIVGDIIAFDNIDYKITVVDTLELTIDRPFRAASEAAFTANDIDIKKTITAAGIVFTGTSAPFSNPAIDIYEKTSFELGGSLNMGSVTNTTPVQLGQGIYEQVKKAEFDAQFNLGNSNLTQWPIPEFDYHAVSGTAYTAHSIISKDIHEGDLQDQMASPVGVTVYFSTTADTQRDAVSAIYEDALGLGATSW